MKHNQHKTKNKRIATTVRVEGNPMYGQRTYIQVTGYHTPKKAHELNQPSWCSLNKKASK